MNQEANPPKPKIQQEDGVKYYMPGQMYKKMNYKDGKLDGSWSIYDDRGILLGEAFFRAGWTT